MPHQKSRDFSATIKKILADNEKTLEFFALSLTLMLSMPKEYHSAIAKNCATQAAKHYYNFNFCSDAKTRKNIQQCFEKTLIATLTQDFDTEKGINLVQIYVSTRQFEIHSVQNSIRSNRPFFEKTIHYRAAQLHHDVTQFAAAFDEHTLDNIKTHSQFKKLDLAIKLNGFKKGSAFIQTMPAAFGLIMIGAVLTCLYQTNNLRLDMMHNEHSKVTFANLAFVVISEIAALFLLLKIGGRATLELQDKHYEILSKKITDTLIHTINVSLAPTKQQNLDHKNPVYHFPLFDLPLLLKKQENKSAIINATPEPRTQPKVKTRPAFAMPATKAAPNAPKAPENTVMVDCIAYHRLFNSQGIPTHDFIGLDSSKIHLDKEAMKKIEPILTHPQLVSKKGESGILDITDEKKQRSKAQHHHLGLFKIKHKAMDERFYTAEKTQTHALNGEAITLHTASISKKHVSRKNH